MKNATLAKILWRLEWLGFLRSSSLAKNLLKKVVKISTILYFLFSGLIFAVAAPIILKDIFPGQPVLESSASFLLYYFGLMFLVRFFFHNLPYLNIKPLINQNIPKKKLATYLVMNHAISPINLFTPLLALTFAISCKVQGFANSTEIIIWLFFMFFASILLHFLASIINQSFTKEIKLAYAAIIALIGLFILDYYQIFSAGYWFGKGVLFVLKNAWMLAVLFIGIIISVFAHFTLISRDLYLNVFETKAGSDRFNLDISFIRPKGKWGSLVENEWRLIFRNKRTKTSAYLSVLMLFYALIFREQSHFLFFAALFVTGVFGMNHGQLLAAWDSSAYSFFMTQNIELKDYVRSKLYVLRTFTAFIFALSLCYFFLDIRLGWMMIAAFIYNMGINIPLSLFYMPFNKKPVTLGKSPFANYQGVSWIQWVAGIPVMLVPLLIFHLSDWLIGFYTGIILVSLVGIVGFFLNSWVLDQVVYRLKRAKYAQIQGFKETN